MEELKPIKARMIACGEIDLDCGHQEPNGLLLRCEDEDWRVAAGVYYVVPAATWDRMAGEEER